MKRLMTLLAAAFMVLAVNAQELANFQRVNVVSPEIKDGQVTFRLKADYATVVELYGSWMPGYGDRVPMTRGENFVWEVTVPAPSPEIYTYNFYVDGVSVNDPTNVLVQRDGNRYLSMLLVQRTIRRQTREALFHMSGTTANSSASTVE